VAAVAGAQPAPPQGAYETTPADKMAVDAGAPADKTAVDASTPAETPPASSTPAATPAVSSTPGVTAVDTGAPPGKTAVDASAPPGKTAVDASTPAAAETPTAPPAVTDWKDARWWAGMHLGYGIIRQNNLQKIADSFRAHWAASGLPYNAKVGNGGLELGGEIGRRLTPNLGLSATVDYCLPGSFTATVRNGSIWWYTQTIRQTLIPLCVNAVGFLPVKRVRATAEAGAGLAAAWMTQTTEIRDTFIGEASMFGLGFCVRGSAGCQVSLDPRHSIGLDLQVKWAKVPKYKGTTRDALGAHDGEVLADENGYVFIGSPTEDARRFAPDFLDLGLKLALTYYY
jgi:hypothetical protein